MNKIYFLILFALLNSVIFAADIQEVSFKNNSHLYMGGVTVTTVSDDTVLIHNPALLNYQKQNLSLTKFNLDYYNSNDNFTSQLDIIMEGDEEEALDAISSLVPLSSSFKFNVSPIISLMTKNFGAGVYLDGYLTAELKRQTNPTTYVNFLADSAISVGYSSEIKLFGKSYIGASLHYLTRTKLYDESTGDEEVILYSSDILNFINDSDDATSISVVNYSGIDMTLGFAKPLTLFGYENTLFGISAKNILGKLSGDKTVDSVTTTSDLQLPMVITTGVSTSLPFFDNNLLFSNPTFAVDYNIVSSDSDVADSLFIGFEQKAFSETVSIKSGINRGYLVGGISLRLQTKSVQFLELSLGRYVEKYGEGTLYDAHTLDSFSVHVLF